jgi:predicted ArsR family transcriptional regulator
LEETAIKQMEVKRAVSEMLANATDLQRRIMEVYMKAEVKPSFTQIGKALGVHHETVKRELAKLAKTTAFDASLLY